MYFLLCAAQQATAGHPQPGCVGYEGQAVPLWSRDRGLGHRLLCTTASMQRRGPQVSRSWGWTHFHA